MNMRTKLGLYKARNDCSVRTCLTGRRFWGRLCQSYIRSLGNFRPLRWMERMGSGGVCNETGREFL